MGVFETVSLITLLFTVELRALKSATVMLLLDTIINVVTV